MSTVSVAVVPRDRFSTTPATLRSVASCTPDDVEIVWVDNGHPRRVARAARAAAPRARAVRTSRWLRPGATHNAAINATTGDYIVLVDNDVLVEPGWLDHLVECAEKSGAAALSPIVLKGTLGEARVHFAGGTTVAFDEGDRTVVDDQMENPGAALSDVVGQPIRRTYLAELHCVLMRRKSLERVGLFDESLTTRELVDWTLRALAAGEEIWFAPSCVVTYVPAQGVHPADATYFLLRWSERWTSRTFDRFEAVHGVAISEQHRQWVRNHRLRAFSPLFAGLARVVGQRRADGVRYRLFSPAEVVANRAVVSMWRRLDPRIW